ncbi:hypothetical protein JCM1841_005173 [Sporobolomyces salmonicolor]
MATPPPGQQQAHGSRPDPHLVALKVLRSTRPSLVPSKSPFYDPRALGGAALRSLEQASATEGRGSEYGLTGALMLPSSFGSIYLGETFNAVLSLSNDLAPSSHPSTIAHSPVLKVEMHTGINPQSGAAAVKHPLANVTAQTPSAALAPGQSQEAAVSWELKELGVHALVCTVTYAVQAVAEDGIPRAVSRSFRKVYKFQVKNPLSVRTKAHAPTPSTPTSFFSPTERRKVFLEVQVQNQCEHTMWFERMRFDPLPGWTLDDEVNEGLFEGEEALLPHGAVRQFVYVLSAGEEVPPAVPASSQGLGRLDIVWRTPHGEIGRLQTSMLGRRVPQPPAPLNLPSSSTAPLEPAPVPSQPESAPGSKPPPAPYRSTSYIARGGTAIPSAVPAVPSPPQPLPPLAHSASSLDFDLTVSYLSSSSPCSPLVFTRDVPFTVGFHLAVSDLSPPSGPSFGKRRRLRLAAQHIQFHSSPLSPPPAPSSLSANPRTHQAPEAAAPTLTLPGALSGAPAVPQTVTSLQQQQHLSQRAPTPLSAASSVSTPRASFDSARFTAPRAGVDPSTPFPARSPVLPLPSPAATLRLPVPHPLPSSPVPSPAVLPSREIVRLGPAVVALGFVTLDFGGAGAGAGEGDHGGSARAEVEFTMRFVPVGTGLLRVGGIRVLVLEESIVEGQEGQEGQEEETGEDVKEEEEVGEEEERKDAGGTTASERHATVVREWDTVAEVWVGSGSGEAGDWGGCRAAV